MIDILMATYNGEKYIKEQIESIVKQSFKDWKLIVHDDGSKDNTVALIEEMQRKYPDKILFINDGVKTGGAKNNFYHLFQYSDGDYIMLADQDDIWKEHKVEKAFATMQEVEKSFTANVPLLGNSDLVVVDATLNTINSSFFDMQKLDNTKNTFKDLLVQNNITGCTTIFNKKLKELCMDMPSEAIMHDWWLGLIASAFGQVFYMDDSEILYRQHGNNTEGAKNLKSPKYLIKKVLDRKAIKESLENTYIQAQKFYEEYNKDLSNDNKEVLQAYLSMRSIGKIARWKIMKKYGFMKSGLVRKISYIFFV